MTYPNAYHGVKKIFTAQILKIIEGFFMFIVAITSFFSAGTAALESALNSSGEASMTLATIALGFIVAAGILAIIAYIMNIVGLRQGGIDEEGFRMGFIVACFAMIIKFVSILFSLLNVGGGIADNIANTIDYICEIIIIVSVIGGVGNLAKKLGNNKLFELGSKLVNVLIAILGLSAAATLVPAFFGINDTLLTASGILTMVAASLSIIGYIIYLVYLGKGVKMLKEN